MVIFMEHQNTTSIARSLQPQGEAWGGAGHKDLEN
jgi:hypothetical protein